MKGATRALWARVGLAGLMMSCAGGYQAVKPPSTTTLEPVM
jgi:hypothetical protein